MGTNTNRPFYRSGLAETLQFARALALVSMLSACTSALPVEHCTPAKQSAFLANCALAVELECEQHPDLCPSPALCKEALEALCPAGR